MRLMTIVYVTELRRSLEFYRALGLQAGEPDARGMWNELTIGDAILALHGAEDVSASPGRRVELAFLSEEPLEEVASRLRASGVALEWGIRDEPFGRSLAVRDPDGLVIQVNEHRPRWGA